MTKRIRLADVAKAARVSQGTASNVFNRPDLVRPEVRERVEAVATELGYTGPDPKARVLRAGKVNAIGLVLADRLASDILDPHNQLFMAGVAAVCDEHGAGLALISARDETQAAWNIRSAVVDGFIVHCLQEGERLRDLARQRGLPFVAVDVTANPGEMAVGIDERGSARRQAEHLIGLGHRRVGVICLEIAAESRTGFVDAERLKAMRYAITRDRLAGYADAFAAVGLDLFAMPIMETVLVRQKGAEATAAILERARETTAILAMADITALGALDYAAAKGIRVPEDLSVIGFDGVRDAELSTPPLTTMAQPIVEKGRKAAEMVFADGPPGFVKLDAALVIRESTAPPRHT